MPRTFQATIALIVTLNVMVVMMIINVWQTNSAERNIIELRQRVDVLNQSVSRISSRLDEGVPMSGGGQGHRTSGGDAGKYEAALNDPDNVLVKTTDQLHHPDAQRGGTLRRVLSSDPKGFNWVTENSVDVRDLQYHVHSQFARQDFNDPDNYVPDLAYKITTNDDFTEYVIHLREGVMWQVPNVNFNDPRYEWLREPRELTAEDAVFFFELMQNPQVEAGALKSYYEDLEGAEVIDRYTFKVTWKRSVAQSMPFTVAYYPMPKWLYTKDEDGEDLPEETLGLEFNNHWASSYPIGTGPYRITRFEAGVRLVLDRHKHYFGQAPAIDRVEYQIIRDPEAAYLRLRAKEVDVLATVPAPRYKSDILDGGPNSPFKDGSLEHDLVDVFAYYYLGWNADKPLFAERNVRLAMTHAFNRQGIIDNVLHGLGSIQTGPYYHEHPAMDPAIEPIKFDLDEAARLLDEAGWKDTDGDGIRDKVIKGEKMDFRFRMTAYGNNPTVRSWLSVYREDLRKIGIAMDPDFLDWPLMQRRMEDKQFDAFTGGWGLSWFNDPYQIWHSSQADIAKGSNRVGFRNKDADKIIETLRETFDPDERITLLRKLHGILHEEQPYTFFYAPKAAAAWSPNLKNAVFQQIRPQAYSIPWYLESAAQ